MGASSGFTWVAYIGRGEMSYMTSHLPVTVSSIARKTLSLGLLGAWLPRGHLISFSPCVST